jgi:hypothetical protein
MTAAAGNIKWQDFRARLEKGLPGSCFLFLGVEEADKNDAVGLCARLFLGADTAETVRVFNAATDSLEDAAGFLLQDSMFASARVCLLHNVDVITTAKKRESALLQEMVVQLPDSALLIMTSPDKSLPASLKPVAARVQQIIFWPMFEERLQQHIMDRCAGQVQTSARRQKCLLKQWGVTVPPPTRSSKCFCCRRPRIPRAGCGAVDRQRKKIPVWDFAPAVFGSTPRTESAARLLDDGAHELQLLKMLFNELERMSLFLSCAVRGLVRLMLSGAENQCPCGG